jgi:hypothetical protein
MLFNEQDALLDNESPGKGNGKRQTSMNHHFLVIFAYRPLISSIWQEANFNESPFSGYLCLLTLE